MITIPNLALNGAFTKPRQALPSTDRRRRWLMLGAALAEPEVAS